MLTLAVVIFTGAASSVVRTEPLPGQDESQRRSAESDATSSVVIDWNNATLEAIRRTRFSPVFAARALAIAHTCMFDAWAAFDAHATPTMTSVSRRRARERTREAETIAISYAAYRALTDLFPTQVALFDEVMARKGLDPADLSNDGSRPSGVGNAACAAVTTRPTRPVFRGATAASTFATAISSREKWERGSARWSGRRPSDTLAGGRRQLSKISSSYRYASTRARASQAS
jgi:hypothetical protein